MTKTNRKTRPVQSTRQPHLEDIALALSGGDIGWNESDSLFSIRVESVEEQFYLGELSAVEAANELELSLEEFVAEFVTNDEWYCVRKASSERQRAAVVADVATALRQEAVGASVRDFALEVLSELPAQDIDVLQRAVTRLPDEPIGQAWRIADVNGSSVRTFVSNVVLPARLRVDLGVDPSTWSTLASSACEMFMAREEYSLSSAWFTALMPFRSPALAGLLVRLEDALARRRIDKAAFLISRLDSGRQLVTQGSPCAVRQLWCYAQWSHFDRAYLPRVEEALIEMRRVPRSGMSSQDQTRAALVEGVVSVFRERYDEAEECFRVAERLASSSPENHVLLVASLHYQSKIEELRGRFDSALALMSRAEFAGSDRVGEAAMARLALRRGWLQFLCSDYDGARKALQYAKAIFKDSSDNLSVGDVWSFEGRMCRKEGRFREARHCFVKALRAYTKQDPLHPDAARTHVNLASTLRMIADGTPAGPRRLAGLQRALWHLERAEHLICNSRSSNQRLLAKVYVARTKIYCAADERHLSELSAQKALALASGLGDRALLSETKRLQALVCADVNRVALLEAEAMSLANQTDDHHLKARLGHLGRGAEGGGKP